MPTITALVTSRNEAELLDRCLSSLSGFADEVIVVNLESTDDTVKIAKKNNAKVINHKLVDVVEEVRQEMIAMAKGDYVLLMDPDEELTVKLKEYLKNIVDVESPDYFEIPRKNIIFGHFMRHSRWWPDYQIRLFKKGAVTWPSVMHAQPEANGQPHQVTAHEELAIVHHNYKNLTEYLIKNLRYAKKDAQYLVDKEAGLTIQETMNKALSEFVSRYFAGQGYLDGVRGFTLAWLQMFYYFLVLFYYWELRRYPDVPEKMLMQEAGEFFTKGVHETLHWYQKISGASVIGKLKSKLLKMLT